MDTQTIILGFLMKRSMTGYELKKAISLSFSFFSGISYGSIYPALKKLESQDMISMRLEVQKHGPNRKVYTILEGGRRAFHASLREPLILDRFKSAFLARLFFFSHLSPKERIEMASGFQRAILEKRNALTAIRSDVEAVADPFQFLCFKFGLRLFEDLAKNVAETVAALEHIGRDGSPSDIQEES